MAVLLVATSGRYGYHRDELYFLACGRHLSWGYPDQPPLVPFIAHIMSAIAPGSLVALRLPSVICAIAVVLVTALTTREFGGSNAAQVLAAGVMACAPILMGASHLLSTTTTDLALWALLLWLVVRLLRTGEDRLWVPVGVVAGVGLLNKGLVAFLVAGLLVGIALVGPRRTFASPWLWVGGVIAAAMWTPWLIWQARHGWPQLDVASSISGGGSGSSTSRWVVVPSQLGLASPYLAPIWLVGLWRMLRDATIRFARPIAIAWVVLAVVFTVIGGKPYYLGGFFPVLLAAGAEPATGWLRRGRAALRRALVGIALVLTVVSSALITLSVVPLADLHRTPIVDVNYDAGEQVAWPQYVAEIAVAYAGAGKPTNTVTVTSNYGEAGAIDRYGGVFVLPHAYSGHNGYWYWGPPPDTATIAVVVGHGRPFLERRFGTVRLVARLHNSYDVDNDEQGAPVWVCTDARKPWSAMWPSWKDLG